jgi:hypothetical protein
MFEGQVQFLKVQFLGQMVPGFMRPIAFQVQGRASFKPLCLRKDSLNSKSKGNEKLQSMSKSRHVFLQENNILTSKPPYLP